MNEITQKFRFHTFEVNNDEIPKGFMVDIIEGYDDENWPNFGIIYNCWLYHKDYGVKEFVFGFPEENGNKKHPIEDVIEILEINLLTDNYIDNYYENHMDHDEEIEDFIEKKGIND